jgi:hypothetical protein
MATMTATKHNADCKMTFGRKDASCPRCRELIAGAAARTWNPSRRDYDRQRVQEIRAHVCTASCGPVCTFGEW